MEKELQDYEEKRLLRLAVSEHFSQSSTEVDDTEDDNEVDYFPNT